MRLAWQAREAAPQIPRFGTGDTRRPGGDFGSLMRLSAYPIQNLKEVPADAEIVSHQLMLRAGLIRKLAAGLYTWLPLGLRVLRKVERIVREEMNRAGALEVLMPVAQPAELWEETGRWDKFGPSCCASRIARSATYCFGPTHEEVITDFARRELKSYKQLPVNFYQIQTKFRDEIRPRFGVMRAREFIMKDAYSFHVDREASLAEGYRKMYDAYTRIFTRLGLKFRAVQADTGAIGGSASHEFHVLADSGEDAIAFSDGDDYAANVETGRRRCRRPTPRAAPRARRCARSPRPASTPSTDVAAFLKHPAPRTAQDAGRRRRGRRPRRAARARRPRAERGQGAEAARRSRSRCAWRTRRDRARRSAASPASSGPVGAQGAPVIADHGVPRSWRTSSAARTRPMPTSPASTGAATCPSPRGRRPPQRRRRRPVARRATARSRSPAASRSATSSSSGRSTPRRWAHRARRGGQGRSS